MLCSEIADELSAVFRHSLRSNMLCQHPFRDSLADLPARSLRAQLAVSDMGRRLFSAEDDSVHPSPQETDDKTEGNSCGCPNLLGLLESNTNRLVATRSILLAWFSQVSLEVFAPKNRSPHTQMPIDLDILIMRWSNMRCRPPLTGIKMRNRKS